MYRKQGCIVSVIVDLHCVVKADLLYYLHKSPLCQRMRFLLRHMR